MRDAIKGVKGARDLSLDFYDRGRIASWLRDHPGLIPWVRQCIGKSIRGWQSYGAWANPVEGIDAEYLVDDKKLEPISKSPEEDNEASELYEAEEVLGVVFPTDEDAALPLNPSKEALHEPASHIAA